MARKGLRNAALLGGAALLAAKMMSGKDKDKKFADTQDAEAGAMLAERGGGGGDTGIATQRLADFRGKSGDADMDIGPRMPRRRVASSAPAASSATDTGDETERLARRYSRAAPAALAATSPLMTDTGDEADRLGRRYPSPVPRTDLMRTSPTSARLGMANMKSGGSVKSYKSGGKVSSASKRADGCAMRGKTKGRMV